VLAPGRCGKRKKPETWHGSGASCRKPNVVGMRNADRLAWPLISAAALAAMVTGHALELWLENLRAFGESRANYSHSMQSFALEVAAILFVIVVATILWRLLQGALAKSGTSQNASTASAPANPTDFVLPALGQISRLGAFRVACRLVFMQFGFLVASELLEQHLAGFGGGLAAVLGPGHASAVVVHLIVGLIFAFALYRAAHYACTATPRLVGVLAIFLRRVFVQLHPTVEALRTANLAACRRRPPLLALGFANRPPPVAIAISA
jgi:hypothetical protein